VRFPGGCGTHLYDWKKSIGKQREHFLFGLDEFLRVAKELGAEPIYTVSYFTGNEQDAADLVEYLNVLDDRKHKWEAKRAENGHSAPYGVKYFEIGNEVYHGDHREIKKVSPEKYAQNYLKYYTAMKAIDPSIQLGIVLDDEHWNRVVIAAIGDKVDFGIIHVYPTPAGGKFLETMPAQQIFDVSLAQPETQYQALFDETKALFQKYSGREVPLAITEFNGGFAQDKPVPYRHTLGCALVNAELLRVFLKPKNNILMANYWNFANEYWGMIANGFNGNPKDLYKPYYKRPNYYVFEMYAKHFGDLLLKADVKSETYDISKYADFKTMLKRIKTGTLIKPNLLAGRWVLRSLEGVEAREKDGVLEIDFRAPKEFNYYHSTKKASVESGAYYKISGYIKTEGLIDDVGVGLEVQDGRGWNVTHSAVSTDTVRGTTDWQFVEAIYQALPDAKGVTVIARRVGEKGPLQGKAYFKDVKFERFIPSLDSTRIPYLSISASKNTDGSKVYLMVVNKDQDKPQTATITLNGFEPVSEGNAWVLNGPAIDSTNEEGHDNVKITQRTFQVPGAKFEYVFEPHSLTAIEIDRS
jgi:alpha-N-arabinofuranosidase